MGNLPTDGLVNALTKFMSQTPDFDLADKLLDGKHIIVLAHPEQDVTSIAVDAFDAIGKKARVLHLLSSRSDLHHDGPFILQNVEMIDKAIVAAAMKKSQCLIITSNPKVKFKGVQVFKVTRIIDHASPPVLSQDELFVLYTGFAPDTKDRWNISRDAAISIALAYRQYSKMQGAARILADADLARSTKVFLNAAAYIPQADKPASLEHAKPHVRRR